MKYIASAAAFALLTAACSGAETMSSEAEAPRAASAASAASPGSTAGTKPKAEPLETARVPARFQGLYAPDRRACAEDYSYNPAFRNVRVRAQKVSFFETGGPVTDVNIDGDAIAITLRETVGDGEFTRAVYLALNGDGTVRYRAGESEPSQTFVRCGEAPSAGPETENPQPLTPAALPLEQGVYVRVGGGGAAPNCPPALASLATFTGEGFGGRNSVHCRFDPAAKDGAVWSGSQTCTDTYRQEKRTEDLTITVESPTRFTREDAYGRASFALCPDEALSDWGG